MTNPGTTPITILADNSDHGLSYLPGRKLGPWSEFTSLYRLTVLLNSGGLNSPWSEFWSEFPHFMGMGVVPAPSIKKTGGYTPCCVSPIDSGFRERGLTNGVSPFFFLKIKRQKKRRKTEKKENRKTRSHSVPATPLKVQIVL